MSKLSRSTEVVSGEWFHGYKQPVCKENDNRRDTTPAIFSSLLLIVESSNLSKTVPSICSHTNTIKNSKHCTMDGLSLITKGTLQTCDTIWGQTINKWKEVLGNGIESSKVSIYHRSLKNHNHYCFFPLPTN